MVYTDTRYFSLKSHLAEVFALGLLPCLGVDSPLRMLQQYLLEDIGLAGKPDYFGSLQQ